MSWTEHFWTYGSQNIFGEDMRITGNGGMWITLSIAGITRNMKCGRISGRFHTIFIIAQMMMLVRVFLPNDPDVAIRFILGFVRDVVYGDRWRESIE